MPGLTKTSSSWPWRTSLLGSPGRCCQAATNTDQQLCQHNGCGKDAFGLEALALPLSRTTTTNKLSTEVCTGSARTKEQSQRCIHSLVPTMGLNVRSAYKDGYARNSSWPGERSPHKGRIHLRRLVFSTKLPLAVARRTIHCGKLRSLLSDGQIQE